MGAFSVEKLLRASQQKRDFSLLDYFKPARDLNHTTASQSPGAFGLARLARPAKEQVLQVADALEEQNAKTLPLGTNGESKQISRAEPSHESS